MFLCLKHILKIILPVIRPLYFKNLLLSLIIFFLLIYYLFSFNIVKVYLIVHDIISALCVQYAQYILGVDFRKDPELANHHHFPQKNLH